MLADIVIVGVIAGLFGLCLKKVVSDLKKGECEGCGGNCSGCHQNCQNK